MDEPQWWTPQYSFINADYIIINGDLRYYSERWCSVHNMLYAFCPPGDCRAARLVANVEEATA